MLTITRTLALAGVMTAATLAAPQAKAQVAVSIGGGGYGAYGAFGAYPVVPPPVIYAQPPVLVAPPYLAGRPYYGGPYRGYPGGYGPHHHGGYGYYGHRGGYGPYRR